MIYIASVVCGRCSQLSGTAFEASPYATPTLEMLRQNATLDPDTRQEIQEIIHQDDTDISFLDGEISKLQITLRRLERQRQTIQTRVERNKALLTPIRRIPVEILQRIFTLCFPFVSTANMKCLPFQVSQVSAHWRIVASKMPELWSKLELNVAAPSMGYIGRLRVYKRFVSLAQDQSGTRPITVSIRAPALGIGGLRGLQALELIASTFSFEFSHRWADLSIEIDLLILVRAQRRVNLKLPAVKRLALLNKPQSSNTLCFVPNTMTRLTHLKLSGCSTPVTQLVGMPWSQITHLEAVRVPINDLGAVLSRMPALTHAQLAPVSARGVTVLQAICLPHLRDLTLSCSQAIICAVAESLTTPILSQFRAVVSLGLGGPQFQSLGQALRAFIDRSSPPITHLGLQHVSPQDMKIIFEGLATVKSLDLAIRDDSNGLNLIMRQLVWSAQAGGFPELAVTNLLPNLQMLTVRRTNLGDTLPDIILMICSRMNDGIMLGRHPPIARLHTVRFRSMDSVPSLVQLRQMGVAVDCMHELRAADIHHLNISTI